MKQRIVMGVDLGTGGCKVSFLNSLGNLVSESYEPYPSYYPHPRWVEQEPEDWVNAAATAIKRGLSLLTDDEISIEGIGFSASHHNAVLLDDNNQVLRNVIMWNDQRSFHEANELAEKHGELIFDQTNNQPTPTWTIAHLLWLKNNEADLYQQIKKIVFTKDYVRYRFSDHLATDYIDAEGTLLYDIKRQQWSKDICQLISLDPEVLPEVYSPTDKAGTLNKTMADILGLPSGIPIITGTADTAAEVYGSGAVNEGDGVVKLATAGNYTLVSNTLPTNEKIITYEHVISGSYYLNSATNFAAASFRWFKENFYKDFEKELPSGEIYPSINKEIEKVEAGSEGLIFQPYLNGERSPHWDPHLRGSFFGCTAKHDRPHFARAVLEGVAYSIKDASLEFSITNRKPLKVIGGGAKGEVWVQILSDVLNTELEIPKVSDASFGLCLIVATAIGWYSNETEAVKACQSVEHLVMPNPDNVRVYSDMFDIYQELHKQTKDLSKKISLLQENN